ncbi:peptidase inhibitor family I36 protein [Actinosynnema sp. NPDC050436]|uniref:peptidase inhibitor family I36 protein n=1 Tax=Actinosynnema sp. NPDC050436 TaxID=3155659 RepID=UPI0033E30BEF
MRRISGIAAVAALVLAGVAGSTTSVTATPNAPETPIPSYSAARLAALQSRVDGHLADYGGGRQVGLNQVEYQGGGMVLTLPLPGEASGRAVDEPVHAQGAPDCPSGSSCVWEDTGYEGARLSRSKCGRLTLSAPFTTSVGSLHNNNGSQTVLFNSVGAFLNANQDPTRINDTGVGTRGYVRQWEVCP